MVMSLPVVEEGEGLWVVMSLAAWCCGRGLFWVDPEEQPPQENQLQTGLNLDLQPEWDLDQDHDLYHDLNPDWGPESGSYRTLTLLL